MGYFRIVQSDYRWKLELFDTDRNFEETVPNTFWYRRDAFAYADSHFHGRVEITI